MDDPFRRLRASVIVPTHNRREAVQRCLRSLLDQDLPPEEYEIIVVDDGSIDGTADALGEMPGRIRVMRQERKGPSAARNRGAAEARGDVLAFLDSDTVADPSWLREALARFDDDPDLAGVEGRTEIPDGDRSGPFGRRTQNLRGQRYLGCNLLFRRQIFEEVGGFDERFGLVPFREDTDLAHRVLRAGGEIRWVPSAGVTHPVEKATWRAPLAHAWRYRNDPHLFAKDWRWYLTRVDVHQLGPVAIWKPRPVVYLVFLIAFPTVFITGASWAAGAAAFSLAGVMLAHINRGAPTDARPHEVLLLILVSIVVPFVFLAGIAYGVINGVRNSF
jgi:GT2 family glycosyltransferase